MKKFIYFILIVLSVSLFNSSPIISSESNIVTDTLANKYDGIDLSESFITDFFGNLRKRWTKGAFEIHTPLDSIYRSDSLKIK